MYALFVHRHVIHKKCYWQLLRKKQSAWAIEILVLIAKTILLVLASSLGSPLSQTLRPENIFIVAYKDFHHIIATFIILYFVSFTCLFCSYFSHIICFLCLHPTFNHGSLTYAFMFTSQPWSHVSSHGLQCSLSPVVMWEFGPPLLAFMSTLCLRHFSPVSLPITHNAVSHIVCVS